MGLPQQRQRVTVDGLGNIGNIKKQKSIDISSAKTVAKSTESGIIRKNIIIPRSVGAAGRNYPVRLPDGNHTKFAEGTEITNIKVFAGKGTEVEVRDAIFLESKYNIPAKEWQKVRGNTYVIVDGKKLYAEIH